VILVFVCHSEKVYRRRTQFFRVALRRFNWFLLPTCRAQNDRNKYVILRRLADEVRKPPSLTVTNLFDQLSHEVQYKP
jgi:hypothetical protein